jgi:hypothetical protein
VTVAILLLVVVAAVAGLLAFNRKQSRVRLVNTVAHYSTRAVEIARDEFGVELDFSDLTLREVDTILEDVGRRVSEENLDATEYGNAFGFYIGEVIRNTEGEGHWQRDHEQFGEGCYPLFVRETAAFPLAWCWKRIENGADDNLVHKMNVMRHAA